MSVLYSLLQRKATGLLSVLLLAVCVIGLAQPVSAADEVERESITLAPVSSRFQIDAGTTKEEELTILNDGNTAYDFIVYARPYSVSNESYDPNFTQTPSNADAYQWVQFRQVSWHAEAGQTIKIPYTVRVPKGAAPGGHYGVIFAETQPVQETNGTSVIRKKRVGSIVYATVKGSYTTGGQSLGSSVPPIQFRAPLYANTTVENTGNADFEAQTVYRVSDLFGNVKYETQKQFIILPATARKLNFEWVDAPWFGLFNVTIEAKFLDQTVNAQSLVLLVPRWLLLVLGVAAVGGGVYATLRIRRR
ncbi:hypothetical protein H7Y40_01515 [Pedobacter sp.]|nr:hypothetical protein [Candidatus Saccharibacteria bacterium]